MRKSSVWNFPSRSTDVLSRGNQRWRREISAVLSSSLINCHRKIPICLVTLLTLKISTGVIVQRVVYFSYFKNVINLFSANFRDFCKVIPFVSRRRSKGFSFQENQTSDGVGDLSWLFFSRLTLRGGNPKNLSREWLECFGREGKKEKLFSCQRKGNSPRGSKNNPAI